MFSIDNNGVVVISSGNNISLPLFINCGKDGQLERYRVKSKDKIYFSICEPDQDFNKALVRKVFTKNDLNKYGDVNITLDSSDTQNILEGQYYYEIKLKLSNGNIETIVPRRKFIII